MRCLGAAIEVGAFLASGGAHKAGEGPEVNPLKGRLLVITTGPTTKVRGEC